MSGATETGHRVAEALRAEWRMIASVSAAAEPQRGGFEAELRLDPVVVTGSLEQQGHPRTPEGMTKLDLRRHAALTECVQRVNEGLPAGKQIRDFAVAG